MTSSVRMQFYSDMLYEAFYDFLSGERGLSELSVDAYRSDLTQLRSFLRDSLGKDDAPSSITLADLRLWLASLSRGKLKASSIKRKVAAVHTFFRFLVRRHGFAVDPSARLVAPKGEKVLAAFVPQVETEQILNSYDVAEEDFVVARDELIVTMLYSTGIRAAELIGLRDVAVDTSACELKVLGKRNKERIIPFGPELKQMIEHYRKLRDELVGGLPPESFFVRPSGEPVYYGLVNRVVHRELAGVQSARRSPHVLRHSFATDMLNNGAEITAVQQLLGHASLRTTQRYTHLSYRELQQNYKLAHPRALKK